MGINVTDKDKAEAEESIGNTRIKVATKGHGTFGPVLDKISNKDRLAMTRQGVKEVLSGRRKANRIKQGLPAIRRPPAAKTKLASAKKRKK